MLIERQRWTNEIKKSTKIFYLFFSLLLVFVFFLFFFFSSSSFCESCCCCYYWFNRHNHTTNASLLNLIGWMTNSLFQYSNLLERVWQKKNCFFYCLVFSNIYTSDIFTVENICVCMRSSALFGPNQFPWMISVIDVYRIIINMVKRRKVDLLCSFWVSRLDAVHLRL